MEYVQSWITILNVTCAQVKKNTDLYRAIQNVCMFYHHHILWGFILGFLLGHVLYCSTEILDDFFFLECWQFNSVSDFFEWFLLMPHTFFLHNCKLLHQPCIFQVLWAYQHCHCVTVHKKMRHSFTTYWWLYHHSTLLANCVWWCSDMAKMHMAPEKCNIYA